MDQLERAFVGAITVRGVEAAQSGAAQRATALGIQREGVLKRGPATDAEVFRAEGLGFQQAFPADGNPGDLIERLATNPAIVVITQCQDGIYNLPDLGANLQIFSSAIYDNSTGITQMSGNLSLYASNIYNNGGGIVLENDAYLDVSTNDGWGYNSIINNDFANIMFQKASVPPNLTVVITSYITFIMKMNILEPV